MFSTRSLAGKQTSFRRPPVEGNTEIRLKIFHPATSVDAPNPVELVSPHSLAPCSTAQWQRPPYLSHDVVVWHMTSFFLDWFESSISSISSGRLSLLILQGRLARLFEYLYLTCNKQTYCYLNDIKIQARRIQLTKKPT